MNPEIVAGTRSGNWYCCRPAIVDCARRDCMGSTLGLASSSRHSTGVHGLEVDSGGVHSLGARSS